MPKLNGYQKNQINEEQKINKLYHKTLCSSLLYAAFFLTMALIIIASDGEFFPRLLVGGFFLFGFGTAIYMLFSIVKDHKDDLKEMKMWKEIDTTLTSVSTNLTSLNKSLDDKLTKLNEERSL